MSRELDAKVAEKLFGLWRMLFGKKTAEPAPNLNTWVEEYREWCDKQVCIDCGAKSSERKEGEWWMTETQCMECWKKFGAPENRGLPGAAEIAARNGKRF